MRGRRAFVILTVYLALLAAFGAMVESLAEQNVRNSFGSSTYASAQIGQTLFSSLLCLETLLVLFLAPAFTTGAISLEREKQTLDLLVTTPISTFAIVVGKLVSALTFVFLLIVASIPLTSIVFVFGGAAPDDLVRAYVLLLVTAVGLGSVGLFWSALMRRTQAATVATYFTVLAVTLGSTFLWVFFAYTARVAPGPVMNPDGSQSVNTSAPPEAILWLNPFVAAADVICGTETGYGTFCGIVSGVTGRPQSGTVVSQGFTTIGGPVPMKPVPMPAFGGAGVASDVVVGAVGVAPQAQLGAGRDTYWPRSLVAWAVLSVVLVVLSVQLVSPTRRWHLRRGGSGRGIPVIATDAPSDAAAGEPAADETRAGPTVDAGDDAREDVP
jgi:ABC-type transport system involved in multi-copper enzyme maturation permease subunit